MTRARPWAIVALTLGLISPAAGAGQTRQPKGAEKRFANLVEAIRHADYRGDRAELKRLAEELAGTRLASRRAQQEYWIGFAWWRRAINGFSESPTPRDLMDDLLRCQTRNRAALALESEFEDALNALANCLGMEFGVAPDKRAEILERGSDSFRKLRELKAVTRNPRTLWVLAGFEAVTPPGDVPKAIDTLLRGLELARLEAAHPREFWSPSWGEAELLMSLSYLHTVPGNVHPRAARGFAEAALFMAPDWQYVRDILFPRIDALPVPSPTPQQK